MSESAQQLKSSISLLSKEDRVELTFFLLDSLTDSDDPTWQDAWESELVGRERAAESGQARYVAAEEVFAKYREQTP